MAEDSEFKRLEPDSPNRCQGRTAIGQCQFAKTPGSDYCLMHGGKFHLMREEKKEASNYRLAKFKARVDDFANNDHVKSLREEVGILRMTLEEIILKCQNDDPEKQRYNLILESAKIADLVTRIEKLVSSCHRLEASTGALLDRTSIIHLSTIIIQTVAAHVNDEEALAKISDQILIAVSKLGSEKLEVA